MSDSELSTAEALERTNDVYWKSLSALFAAASAIILFILIYTLSDSFFSECNQATWLQRVLGAETCERTPSIFLITVMAGAIGAIFSNITRLYQIGEVSALFAQKIIAAGPIRMGLYAGVPAVIGAVAAAVIYLIFAGKFIQGTPFPAFGCDSEQGCGSIGALLNHWGPDQAEDYAKMIFWGFVGGFSERLVPDMLGQYSKLIEQKAIDAAKNQKELEAARAAAEAARSKAGQDRAAADEASSKAALSSATQADKDAAAKAETQATAQERKASKAEEDYKTLQDG